MADITTPDRLAEALRYLRNAGLTEREVETVRVHVLGTCGPECRVCAERPASDRKRCRHRDLTFGVCDYPGSHFCCPYRGAAADCNRYDGPGDHPSWAEETTTHAHAPDCIHYIVMVGSLVVNTCGLTGTWCAKRDGCGYQAASAPGREGEEE